MNVREDEILVEVDGLLIVLCSIGKFAEDEVQLCTVVVDIWIRVGIL